MIDRGALVLFLRAGRTYTPEERRAYFVSFLAFFVAGLSVYLSLDLETGRLMPYGWYLIPLGIAASAAIYFAFRPKNR